MPSEPPPRSPPPAVALDCEMVEVLCADGRLRDAAASVCVVDEYERVLLFSLVRPAGPVTDYRTDYTGAWLSCVYVCAVWFWVTNEVLLCLC